MEIELKENEEINDLEYKGLKIIQNKQGFCFGIDSVLLSDFAKEIKEGSKVLDLGTGTGIIGILLCKKSQSGKIIGIEIQGHVCDMAKRSIKINNLQNSFEVINENIKNLDRIFEKQSIDVVVTNPPYKKDNTGMKNENKTKLISRHEIECSLEDIVSKSSYVLKNNGALYMVHRPERLVDIIFNLRKYNLEPKKIRFVHSKENTSPKLMLIKAIKNAKPFLEIEEPLIIYNNENSYTDEILKIYNKNNMTN